MNRKLIHQARMLRDTTNACRRGPFRVEGLKAPRYVNIETRYRDAYINIENALSRRICTLSRTRCNSKGRAAAFDTDACVAHILYVPHMQSVDQTGEGRSWERIAIAG